SVAKADALARRAAIHRRYYNHADGLGDGAVGHPRRFPNMVVLNRIYTRTGDDGTTALATGERRKKNDLRIACYGTVAESNAAVGVVRLYTSQDAEIDAMLGRIQNDLFDLGADLCSPASDKGKGPGGARLTVTEAQVVRLEDDIDRLNADLKPLRSFVLPGGT